MSSVPSIVTMNVSLPQPLKKYVDGRVSSGVYGSASEFIREAIREKLQRDQARETADAALTSALLHGLDSGSPISVSKSYFKRKKRALAVRPAKSKRI
jgi:antitoxin ParD1/3/4